MGGLWSFILGVFTGFYWLGVAILALAIACIVYFLGFAVVSILNSLGNDGGQNLYACKASARTSKISS